jgi:hypothetical protein
MPSLFDLFDRFDKRMREVILPFWASEGFMPRIGQFGEQTDLK